MPELYFSIITVCFNEGGCIESTCDSILEQTYDNYEWIVVDGGSTDGTLDILEKYESEMSTFISEPDEGIYDAMNKGIKKASGKYIVFMNGGDRFFSCDVLEAVASVPAQDLIVGDAYVEEESPYVRIPPDSISREYFGRTTLPHQSSFIARKLFLEYGLYEISYDISGDMEFFARIYQGSDPTYFHLHKTLVRFDGFGVSSDPKNRWKRRREDHRLRWQYYPEYRKTMKCFRQILRGTIRKVFR